jgi:hypothetical protein
MHECQHLTPLALVAKFHRIPRARSDYHDGLLPCSCARSHVRCFFLRLLVLGAPVCDVFFASCIGAPCAPVPVLSHDGSRRECILLPSRDDTSNMNA